MFRLQIRFVPCIHFDVELLNGYSPGRKWELAFWVVGAALLTLYFSARFGGEIERKQAITAFVEARASASVYPSLVTPKPLPRSNILSTMMPSISESTSTSLEWTGAADDGSPAASSMESLPIALLRIARVGLEVPVYTDTGERNLNRGAGWVEGTATPDDGGNMAIAGHRDGYFRSLKDVVVGDVLELESKSRLGTYRVTEISIVEPEDISPLSATETPAVTLVTCYPFYFVGHAPQRYIVRALAL